MAQIVHNGSYTLGIKAEKNFEKDMVVLAYHQQIKNFLKHCRPVSDADQLFIEHKGFSYPAALIAIVRMGENDYSFFDISHGEWHGSYGIRSQLRRPQLYKMGVWYDVERNMNLITNLDVSTNTTDAIIHTIKL